MSIRIPLASIKDADIETMEKALTIEMKKKQDDRRRARCPWIVPEKVLFVQKENEMVYVPFFWGKEYFGKQWRPLPQDCYPFPNDVRFLGVLRPEQKQIKQEAIEALNETSTCLLAVYPGGGKCLARGTLVRMFDGSSRTVESIRIGDRLRGPDTIPRTVISLGHGYEQMYTIHNNDAISYTVNASHIMTVFDNESEKIIDIPLMEIMGHCDRYQGLLYKKGTFFTFPMIIEMCNTKTEYFGFTLLENPRFLLANDVCTHNTITSLSICSSIKMRTLIIVNKLVLIQQWKEAIEMNYGDTCAPFVIQGNTKNIPTHHLFYIVNAINVSKHCRQIYNSLRIGIVIVDECHLIMTRVFSNAMAYLCPRYLIGLSATPYRNDGFNILLDLYFGIRRVVRKLHRPHIVYPIMTGIVMEAERDARGDIIWNSIIEQQIMNKTRADLILRLCEHFSDRSILILSKRIAQIEHLHDRLKERGDHVAMLKENETRFDRDARILISTFQKVGTGFSHDRLDMLILACDTEEYFMQYLGRVFRRPDVKPIICDLIDNHPILKKHFKNRLQVYTEAGGTIYKTSPLDSNR